MAAHGAGGRGVQYIGSDISSYNDSGKGRLIYDYYRDTAGTFWYKNRVLLPNGEIVSMEQHIFGKEIRKEKYTTLYRKSR